MFSGVVAPFLNSSPDRTGSPANSRLFLKPGSGGSGVSRFADTRRAPLHFVVETEIVDRGNSMGNDQKRGNREAKKPKQIKPQPVAAVSPNANRGVAAQPGGGKKK